MLTAKKNMRAVVKGGQPDRLVNQYEAMQLLFYPYMMHSGSSCAKGENGQGGRVGHHPLVPGERPRAFPVHTQEKKVVKDIEHWREVVHAPKMEYPQEEWDTFKAMYDAVDGTKAYKTMFYAPGLFEMSHYLCSMEDALEYYMTDPDEMMDMIKYITEFELKLAEDCCKYLKPDCILHHDDWGSAINSFLRPSMFEDFFVEPYKQIYGYYHDHGVEIIVHHSDSYAANLVPSMIEMGIDVWQGCVESNDVPDLIKRFGDKITFMGNIDNKAVDFNGWTDENCREHTAKIIQECGDRHFIPCITQGGPGSVYPGVYMSIADFIDEYNAEHYGLDIEEIRNARLPHQILF
jgi:hypothetical protein